MHLLFHLYLKYNSMYVCMYVYIYIYIYMCVCVCVCVCVSVTKYWAAFESKLQLKIDLILNPFMIRLSVCLDRLFPTKTSDTGTGGVSKLFFRRMSIISYRNLLMSSEQGYQTFSLNSPDEKARAFVSGTFFQTILTRVYAQSGLKYSIRLGALPGNIWISLKWTNALAYLV